MLYGPQHRPSARVLHLPEQCPYMCVRVIYAHAKALARVSELLAPSQERRCVVVANRALLEQRPVTASSFSS
eukprot:scaffold3836_cov417-Prasinococcus_capsulatus_cf.AAC.8